MNIRSLGALLVLNVVLLVALVMVTFSPQPAQAQLGGGGAYTMLAGRVQGRTQEAVYIVDLQRGLVIATIFNTGNKTFEPIDARNLANDMQAQPGGGR